MQTKEADAVQITSNELKLLVINDVKNISIINKKSTLGSLEAKGAIDLLKIEIVTLNSNNTNRIIGINLFSLSLMICTEFTYYNIPSCLRAYLQYSLTAY